ncbi:MAG: copper-translocating P-type ATPase [Candidatus Chisholmbacteria bacterium RIFCSPHIGHO2_01_FULL_49_18]|uniref:Copper-translocating P-type ATPase n=1 Tax=Candidatus Chisholmbacteria bacterium RIFCSPHIGHO2_01_FULL_49_18 TaxID=1797590 RepID=A0A1G1VPQ9_9BACT|nr:MAG: copper-translocating P-type ATPase [Candidatus Chisholmbacteria bacterium RIFCSPHIGHO2_01_FULL_49_18]
MMMAGPNVAQEFLGRFFAVTVLLIPLALVSEPAVKFLGVPDFSFRPVFMFAIATAIFYFSLIFFEHASHEIKARNYGMMTLVSMGVGAGYLFSAIATFLPAIKTEFYLEISTLIWVLLFGHYLEAKSSSAAGDALQEVAKLLPKEAHRKQDGQVVDVPLEQLKAGDIVLVKPGEKVPADGEITSGSASFNESHISGESKPVEKGKGAQVVAGAISIDGSVEVKLSRVGDHSTIGQIKNLIAQAQKTKPSVQRLADRASKWLTFSALAVSIMTVLIWSLVVGEPFVFAVTLAITVLVIACPHALGLAIPTVSTIATRLAVKNGVFLKDMGKIEVIKNADYVVFDKTGTLTRGNFGVTDVKLMEGKESELLKIAAAIEKHSSHVIGMSIVDFVKEKRLAIPEAKDVKNLSGRGMQAVISGKPYVIGNQRLMEEKGVWTKKSQSVLIPLSQAGKTPVFVAGTKSILGIIALSDEVKPESKTAVDELHELGVKVAMLTGDTKEAADPVARELGIDMVFARVLPEDKYKHIMSLQESGSIVVMACDGVNDAPALKQADAGVAIGAGTDVAVEAGDIVLTQSNPQHLVRLIILSRKVYAKMVQNLWWALGYNILAIPAAAGLFIPLGFRLTPAFGALLMSLSSVIVVVNAMTLRKADLKVKDS